MPTAWLERTDQYGSLRKMADPRLILLCPELARGLQMLPSHRASTLPLAEKDKTHFQKLHCMAKPPTLPTSSLQLYSQDQLADLREGVLRGESSTEKHGSIIRWPNHLCKLCISYDQCAKRLRCN